MFARTLLCSICLISLPGFARAAELRLVSSPAMRAVAGLVAEAYAKVSGDKVTVDFNNGEAAANDAKSGKPLDVTIQSVADIALMSKAGVIDAASAADLSVSSVALGVKHGAPLPAITTPAEVKAALTNAKTIGYSAGTSGLFFMEAMQNLGIADMVKQKAEGHVIRGSVGEIIAKGDVDIGAQQFGELLPVKGVDILGNLPAGMTKPFIYQIAIGAKPTDAKAARALEDYFRSPAAADLLVKAGFPQAR